MSDDKRIVLSEDDFTDSGTDLTAGQLAASQAAAPPAPPVPPTPPAQAAPAPIPSGSSLPPVTRREPLNVNATPLRGQRQFQIPAQAQSLLTNPRIAPVIAAVLSTFVGWMFAEILGLGEADLGSSSGDLVFTSGIWIGFVGMIFGATMLTFDRIFAGAWEDALRRWAIAAGPMLVIGFMSGACAQLLYAAILPDDLFASNVRSLSYLARVLGWALFGFGIGAGVGVLSRSSQRAVNGAIGGAVGGAVGGLIFEMLSQEGGFQSAAMLRLIGLFAVAVMIALAVRIVEQVRREAWLSIISGGMSGKEFILYHQQTRIGASPECEIFLLKDLAVAKHHAWIEDRGSERVLHAAPGCTSYLNGESVTSSTIPNGAQLQFGNTVILYSERALAPVPPKPISH